MSQIKSYLQIMAGKNVSRRTKFCHVAYIG